MNDKNPFAMSVKDVAIFYGKNISTVNKWQTFTGYPKHAHIGRGLIDIKILNDWYMNYFYSSNSVTSSLSEAKLRREIAKARRDELLTQKLEGELISVDEVSQDLIEVLGAFKQRLMAWVKRLPPVLKGKEEKHMMKILDDEIWQILDELSKGLDNIDAKNKAGLESNKH